MADDAQITEEYIFFERKRSKFFFYAVRYGTKVKSCQDFSEFFWEILDGR